MSGLSYARIIHVTMAGEVEAGELFYEVSTFQLTEEPDQGEVLHEQGTHVVIRHSADSDGS